MWTMDDDYPASEWTFEIPYEIEAPRPPIQCHRRNNIGGSYYSGSSGPGLLVTNGVLSVPISISSGTISEGDQIRFTLRYSLCRSRHPEITQVSDSIGGYRGCRYAGEISLWRGDDGRCIGK